MDDRAQALSASSRLGEVTLSRRHQYRFRLYLAARALQLNRHLQANTERRRDVLSTFFIGRELLKRLDDLPRPVIDLALLTLRHNISSATPA